MLREGRVEVWNEANENWGTVCQRGFDENAANVVCNMLGYNSSAYFGTEFGPGTGTILLDNLQCTGDEHNLFDCPNSGIGNAGCSHSEDVGVICGRK